jgi:GH18 family chitinase
LAACRKAARQYGFDGTDIDYECATSAGHAGNPDDFWIFGAARGVQPAGYVNPTPTLLSKLDVTAVTTAVH